jgi:hypothetical protein
LKKISRDNLSTVTEEKPDMEQIYSLTDKPYYVDNQMQNRVDYCLSRVNRI